MSLECEKNTFESCENCDQFNNCPKITEYLEEVKERGKRWAEGFKRHNSTREEAYEAEESGRSYSPFEFIAHEFNSLMAAVNDDYTGLEYYYDEPEATERTSMIKAGLDRLGNIANTGHVRTFSPHGCDCCGSDLAGKLHSLCEIKTGVEE